MTRQDFIGKTAGTINQNNANQIYAMLCNLVDTAAPADDTKHTLTISLEDWRKDYDI